MAKRTILKTWLVISIFLVVLGGPATVAGKTIYVDDDATGANDGSSWENAYTFLQDAFTYSKSSGEQAEIRVAQGVYKPNQGLLPIRPPGMKVGRGGESYLDPGLWPIDLGDKAAFKLLNGVVIKGGYAGFGEPDPNMRDVNLYQTVLSGDINGDDIDVSDPCDLLDERTRFDNCGRVVVGSNTDETAVLDGFTVTSGHGHTTIAIMGPPPGGAGMHISYGSPTLINCTFTGNAASFFGGGLYNLSSSPTLINCTFIRNYAGGGAGMCNYPSVKQPQNSNPTLINCIFDDNYANNGGGMYNLSSNPTLTNCTFTNNFNSGIHNRMSNPVLTNCEFIENSASSGGGIYNEDSSSPILTDCTFTRNSADESFGGGICSEDANNIILTNCMFFGNSAKSSGGGMFSRRSNMKLNNCLFIGNKTYGEPWPNQSEAGGLYAFGDTTLTNCTFYGNWAQEGRAILKYSSSNLRLKNCILWDGGDEISSNGDSLRTELTYSNVQGGWPGEGNINEDPLFANTGYWASANDPNQIAEPNDPNAIWIDGDYHLKSQAGRWNPASESWVQNDVTSPCIDAGDPNSPIGHEPFPNGGIINIGAYGGTVEASKSYFGRPACETIIAGDINGDCKVDFDDLMILMAHWLEER